MCLLLLRDRSVGCSSLGHNVLRVQLGSRRCVVPIGGGSSVVARGSSSRGIAIRCGRSSVCVLLLPGVHAFHSKGRLSQASIGSGPLVGSCRCCTIVSSVSFGGHQVHKGVISRRSRRGARRGICTGGIEDILVLLPNTEFFLDPSFNVRVGHVIGNFRTRKGHGELSLILNCFWLVCLIFKK